MLSTNMGAIQTVELSSDGCGQGARRARDFDVCFGIRNG